MISFDIERDLYNKNIIMIGVDEVKGFMGWPIVSTACWFDLPNITLHSEINDSKKLNRLSEEK